MPDMQRVDGSPVHTALGWLPPPTLSVCEPAPVLDRGESSWPFLYSYRGGQCFVNAAPKKTAYAQAEEIGDALI